MVVYIERENIFCEKRKFELAKSKDSQLVDSNKALAMENELVLKYMSMYGWQKVRGGCYNLISEAITYQTLCISI